MEDEIMNQERFESIKKMLESSDVENQTLALSILAEQDFVKNAAFILLCKKYSNADNTLWNEHAEGIMIHIRNTNALDVNRILTFKNILEALVEIKAPPHQIKFFMEAFGIYLNDQLKTLGYDFIENLEINIKLKPEYETR